jgi:hypothetical protein
MARSSSGAETKARKATPGKAAAKKAAKPPSRTAKGAGSAATAARPAEETRLSVAAALLRKSARRIGI